VVLRAGTAEESEVLLLLPYGLRRIEGGESRRRLDDAAGRQEMLPPFVSWWSWRGGETERRRGREGERTKRETEGRQREAKGGSEQDAGLALTKYTSAGR
jgi:hypothetical protein